MIATVYHLTKVIQSIFERIGILFRSLYYGLGMRHVKSCFIEKHFFTNCLEKISCGEVTSIRKRVKLLALNHTGCINISDYAIIGDDNTIISHHKITIGNGVLMGRKVVVTDLPVNGGREKGLKIGDNVWIGENVRIIGSLNIGDSAIIGAGALVTKDVPANTIVAGIPARVIKKIN